MSDFVDIVVNPNSCFIYFYLFFSLKIYKKKLIRLVEQYRLINDVIFIDNFELMPIAYKISDIVISSSIEPEAFGRVAVEAQAMEKPIIASNIGGSNETIIDENGKIKFNRMEYDLDTY